MPFTNRANDPRAPYPNSSPSDRGKLEQIIIEQRKENVELAKKVEEMAKYIGKLEEKKMANSIGSYWKLITEKQKAVAAAIRTDPPRGKTYVKCKDLEKFMDYCVKHSSYYGRRGCAAYIDAWRDCQDKSVQQE